MKRIVLVAILALFVTSSAQAQAPTGWAVGYDQAVQGISLRYLPTGGVGAEVMAGLTIDSPKADNLGTGYNLNLGANVLWSVFSGARARLVGFGGGQLFLAKPPLDNADTQTTVALLVGLEPEVFVWDSLSLSTRMGLQIRFVGDQLSGGGQSIDDSGRTVFGTFGPEFNLLEGINIRYYF